MTTGPIERCQICDTDALESALFLGYLPPVNSMRALGSPADSEPWHPAELLICPRCHLAQLGYVVEPQILFPPGYPYTSGTTRVLRENFADLHREAVERLGLGSEDFVIDIGSNDGTLLSNFHAAGHRVLGIEPTLTADIATSRGIETIMSFFGEEVAERVRRERGAARVVTAANVFAHIPDVHSVMDAIAELLDDDGVFISESHYFRDLVETLQYDTIYHEHLRYYSLSSLSALFELHGFRVVYARRIPTHGGSIRVYATRNDRMERDGNVDRLLREEAELGLTDRSWVDEFRRRVVRSKLDLYALLGSLVGRGASRVYGIGAPSRASTLVNYTGLDDGLLSAVLEVPGSKKLDKYLPGTAIPVLDESKLYRDQPEFALLLSWHIADELMENLRGKGYEGSFIVPLPEPRLVAA